MRVGHRILLRNPCAECISQWVPKLCPCSNFRGLNRGLNKGLKRVLSLGVHFVGPCGEVPQSPLGITVPGRFWFGWMILVRIRVWALLLTDPGFGLCGYWVLRFRLRFGPGVGSLGLGIQ